MPGTCCTLCHQPLPIPGYGNFVMDLKLRTVRRGTEKPVQLARSKFEIFKLFFSKRGEPVHVHDMIFAVSGREWRDPKAPSSGTIYDYISELKKEIEPFRLVITNWHEGWYTLSEVEPSLAPEISELVAA